MGNVSVQCERGEDGESKTCCKYEWTCCLNLFLLLVFSSHKSKHQNKVT